MAALYKLIVFIAAFNFGSLLAIGLMWQMWPFIIWLSAALWACVGGFAYSRGSRHE